MYNKTLKRPMFRKGGDVRRQGYSGAGIVDKIAPTQSEMEKLRSYYPQRAPDNSRNDFLINFGLDLASRPAAGNIFQTAAQSAQKPFGQYQQSKGRRSENERTETTNMINTIMSAKAKALGSEGGSNMFSKDATALSIGRIMDELFTLKAAQTTDQAIETGEYQKKENKLLLQLQNYTGRNPAVDSLFKNKEQSDVVVQGIQKSILDSEEMIKVIESDGEEIEVVEGEYALANPSYLGKKTQEIYLGQYSQAVKQSLGLGKAKGGRINYATGEMVEQVVEKVAEPEEDSLSYEELRSRLPEEITDDIVVILSESPSALVDFSEIQTQIDVDEFNMKYGVNLSLPSGA